MKNRITMDDIFRDWDSKIAKTIINSGISFSEVEDIKSDIYLSMIRRNLCEKFDPNRAGSVSTYIYKIVHSLVKNAIRDFNCKKRIPRNKFVSLSDCTVDDHLDSTLFTDTVKSLHSFPIVEQNVFIEKILLELDKPENYKVIVGKDGASITLKSAAKLFLSGYSLKDIADLIGVTTQKVKNSFRSLRFSPRISKMLLNSV